MVAASGLAPPRAVAPCPRTRGGHRFGFLRSAPPVAAAAALLRCCASTVDDSVVSAAAPKPRLPRVVSMGSKLIGCGSATPALSVSNDDLSKIVETSDEWIAARTGIRNRRILSGDETLRGLSVQAAQRDLEMAQVKADDVDIVLLCTSTPDDLFGDAARCLILAPWISLLLLYSNISLLCLSVLCELLLIPAYSIIYRLVGIHTRRRSLIQIIYRLVGNHTRRRSLIQVFDFAYIFVARSGKQNLMVHQDPLP